MRVLLSTYGSRGDVEPVVGLAVALQAQGAEVRVCAPADAEFVALLDRVNVPWVPAFSGVREWIAKARETGMALPALAAIMLAGQYAVLDAAAEGCDVVLTTGLFPSSAAAQCVAERRGLSYLFAVLYPLLLPSQWHRPPAYPGHPHPAGVTDPRALWALNIEVMNALFGEPVNRFRESIGLHAVDDVRQQVFAGRPLLASDPALWPWQATDLSDPLETGSWILPDTRALPASLEAFLQAGAPPVYIGFGSMAMQAAKDAARVALAVVRARGLRAVVARGWVGLVPLDDRDDCVFIDDVSHQALFKHVAAVVHHGGAGTTTAAAHAGVPQVIVPQIVDQPHWAARVTELGIGATPEGPAPNFDLLSSALDIALRPVTRERAAGIVARLHGDGAAVAAKAVLDLARPGRARVAR